MLTLFARTLSFSSALWTMILLNSSVIVFHLLVLSQIISFEVVWGGRLKTFEEMVVFESVSLSVNLFLMIVLLIKGAWIKGILSVKVVNVLLWMFILIFALNTIGNLFSKTNLETYIATPLTLLAAICCLRLVLPVEGKVKKTGSESV